MPPVKHLKAGSDVTMILRGQGRRSTVLLNDEEVSTAEDYEKVINHLKDAKVTTNTKKVLDYCKDKLSDLKKREATASPAPSKPVVTIKRPPKTGQPPSQTPQ